MLGMVIKVVWGFVKLFDLIFSLVTVTSNKLTIAFAFRRLIYCRVGRPTQKDADRNYGNFFKKIENKEKLMENF